MSPQTERRRLLRSRAAIPLIAIVLGLVLAVLLASVLAPYEPDQTDLDAQLQRPSAQHPLGTDFYGRDLLSRLLYGGRATLAVAVAAVLLAATVGSAMGLLAGSSQGWPAQVWAGIFDLMLAFPTLLLALMVVAVVGPGLAALGLAVGIAGIPSYARLVRGLTLSLRSALFVEAARALGADPLHILHRHLVRNAARPVLALATVDLGLAIISVAALGYLGLGASPPQSEWGLMLYEGRGYMTNAPWASLVPGLAITVTVWTVTLLGDALTE